MNVGSQNGLNGVYENFILSLYIPNVMVGASSRFVLPWHRVAWTRGHEFLDEL
jgi:hypothetical protein